MRCYILGGGTWGDLVLSCRDDEYDDDDDMQKIHLEFVVLTFFFKKVLISNCSLDETCMEPSQWTAWEGKLPFMETPEVFHTFHA